MGLGHGNYSINNRDFFSNYFPKSKHKTEEAARFRDMSRSEVLGVFTKVDPLLSPLSIFNRTLEHVTFFFWWKVGLTGTT